MCIREQIKNLAALWINPEYAKRFDASVIVKDLIVHAFVNRIGGPESDLLHEAWKRLRTGNLSEEYSA